LPNPAVLFGGPSPEHDVSILTGLQAARALGDVTGVYWSKDAGLWEVDHALEAERAELAALLQARHADLEELVEVGAGDCQELDALEERYVVVLRLRQYAPVELEKGQLAVYEELGRL